MTETASAATILAMEGTLRKLSYEFAYYVDHHLYDDLIELFTPDAVLGRLQTVFHGRAEILAGLKRRSWDVVTRHTSAGFHYKVLDAETARGVVYNISYFGDVSDDFLPAMLDSPQIMVIDFHDLYKLTAQGWKIAERFTRPVMLPPNSAINRESVRWRPAARLI